MVIFDTWAIITILKKEEGYEYFKELYEKGGAISQASLYELASVVVRDSIESGLDLDSAVDIASILLESVKKYLAELDITTETALVAVDFRNRYKKLDLSHFDCIALATAKSLNQKLCTGDKDMKKVKEVDFI